MQTHDRYYDIFPKVLCVGKEAKITVRQKFDNVGFKEGFSYTFELSEMETERHEFFQPEIDGNTIKFSFTPKMEQEYQLMIRKMAPDGTCTELTKLHFYAVGEDLIKLKPWKGDFHNHSCRSDGKDSPLFVASNYRRAGFDFFALTDHERYAPSLEVTEGFKCLDTDFKVYPGEEVHVPDTETHHVNFGGSFSVNELSRKEDFKRETAEIKKSISHPWMTDEDKTSYASSLWVFRKIREGGGVSIFCHPYWIPSRRYNVDESIIKAAFIDKEFDACEILGGYHRHELESSALQTARWYEERAKGNFVPPVGVSDSHGTVTGSLFPWYYTIVFAPTTEFADLRDAIRNGKCVAVSKIGEETTIQIHGEFRLVKYAYFLQREIFPLHDEECIEEGRQMLKFFGGDESAAKKVASYKGSVPSLYKKLFA